VQTEVFSRCAEAAAKIGLDCMQVGVLPFKVTHDLDAVGVPMISDAFGRVWRILNNAGNINPYYIRGRRTRSRNGTPRRNACWGLPPRSTPSSRGGFFKSINNRNKDSIFVIATNDLAGVFESTWQGMGIEFFSRQLHKTRNSSRKPSIPSPTSSSPWTRGSWTRDAKCSSSPGTWPTSTGRSCPQDYRDHCFLPAYQKVTGAIHERGKKAVLHTDGYVTPLLDFVIDAGFDGLHSLEPTAGVDLAEVKARPAASSA